MCDRINIPNEFRDLAKCVLENYSQALKVAQLSPEEILRILERCDSFRKEDKFFQFIKVCEIVAKVLNKPFNHALLKRAFQVAKQINVQNIIASLEDIGGEKIREAVRQARIKAISSLVEQDSTQVEPKRPIL